MFLEMLNKSRYPARFDGNPLRRVTSPPMRLHAQRRFIAGSALLAFLFAIAFPALAVARQAVDPLVTAKICRIDTGAAGDIASGVSGSQQGKLKTAHCVMCVGTVSPPPVIVLAAIVVSTIPELLLPVCGRPLVVSNLSALQPLNPRAPPRA